MIKHYCDKCGDEITNENRVDGKTYKLETNITKNGESIIEVVIRPTSRFSWEDTDICKYCILSAINKLDDRPRMVV